MTRSRGLRRSLGSGRADRAGSGLERQAQRREGAGVERRRAVAAQPVPAGGGDHRRVVGAHRPARHEHPAAVLGRAAAAKRSRSSELAATPPPRTIALAPTCSAARRALRTSTSTTAAWNDAAMSVGRHVGVLAHVVDHGRLQPAEADVEAVVEHRPREARPPSGSPCWAAASIAGPPG